MSGLCLEAINLGKKYNRDWIIRDFNYTFSSGQSYAITGHNGQGKSTLVKLLCGYTPKSTGHIRLEEDGKPQDVQELYNVLTIAAPYSQLIEEFTTIELLDFHTKFKPLMSTLDYGAFLEKVNLIKQKNKPIKYFSSGMKQRLKVGLSLFTASKLIFLDEPTVNLDENGKKWYLDSLKDIDLSEKIVIIASNDKSEYGFCGHVIDEFLF